VQSVKILFLSDNINLKDGGKPLIFSRPVVNILSFPNEDFDEGILVRHRLAVAGRRSIRLGGRS
jgi:hypothetical protein